MVVANSRIQARVFSVLNRQSPIDAIGALIRSLQTPVEHISLNDSAVAFDSSVFLRLASHKKGSDITDYFRSKHKAPIILPGQAIQEFWNNQLTVVDTMESSVEKDFNRLKKTINEIGEELPDCMKPIEDALNRFKSEHAQVYSKASVSATLSLLKMLQAKAIITYGDRSRFSVISQERKRCKTPPGYKDSGDGDFYIWVDTLCALGIAKRNNCSFRSLVIVTNDRKEDWSRGISPHPILAAELQALYRVPLCLWTLDQLAKACFD